MKTEELNKILEDHMLWIEKKENETLTKINFFKLMPEYLISSGGSVFSIMCKQGFRNKPREVKHAVNDGGYRCVTLNRKRFFVHRLVASEFCGLDINDKKKQVHHIDKDKSNNKHTNLIVLTAKEHLKFKKDSVKDEDLKERWKDFVNKHSHRKEIRL
jgi:hypothetical protein